MKPKPFSSLNHFTVPVGMLAPLLGMCCGRRGCESNDGERWHDCQGDLAEYLSTVAAWAVTHGDDQGAACDRWLAAPRAGSSGREGRG
jgi:hypothetical protein